MDIASDVPKEGRPGGVGVLSGGGYGGWTIFTAGSKFPGHLGRRILRSFASRETALRCKDRWGSSTDVVLLKGGLDQCVACQHWSDSSLVWFPSFPTILCRLPRLADTVVGV